VKLMANDNRLSGKYQKYERKIVLKSNFIGLNDTVIRIMLKKIDEKSNEYFSIPKLMD
jgi:hypothetical protein